MVVPMKLAAATFRASRGSFVLVGRCVIGGLLSRMRVRFSDVTWVTGSPMTVNVLLVRERLGPDRVERRSAHRSGEQGDPDAQHHRGQQPRSEHGDRVLPGPLD